MHLHSSTYPQLRYVVDGQAIQFVDGHAEVSDELGELALKEGHVHGVSEADSPAASAPVDPTGEAATFGYAPADPRLPSAATTDIGAPGTAPGETTPVGDRPRGVATGDGATTDVGGTGTAPGETEPPAPGSTPAPVGAAPAGDVELPDPLPEDLTDLSLPQLKAVAARHGIDAAEKTRKKQVLELLPERDVLIAGQPSTPTSPNAGDPDADAQVDADANADDTADASVNADADVAGADEQTAD